MKEFLAKYTIGIIPLVLAACVSPISQEEFLIDKENIEKIDEFSQNAVPDSEECEKIQNFINKDTITKKDVIKILEIIQVDPKSADTSEKLSNISYAYVKSTCYVGAPIENIKEYCSKKYYQSDNCIKFLTEAYPKPMSAELADKMKVYIQELKEKEKKEAIKAWEKSTGCKYTKSFRLQGRWGVLQQISAGTLITQMEPGATFRYAMQSMYGQSDVYLVVTNPEYKNMVDGEMFDCSVCVGGNLRHDMFQQIGTYQYTTAIGSQKTVKKLKACINKK